MVKLQVQYQKTNRQMHVEASNTSKVGNENKRESSVMYQLDTRC